MNLASVQSDWTVKRLDMEKEKKPFKKIFSVSIETGEKLFDERQQIYSNHSSSK